MATPLTATPSARPVVRLDWRRNLLLSCMVITEMLWIAPLFQWLLVLFYGGSFMPLNLWIGLVGSHMFAALVLRRILHARQLTNQQQVPFLVAGFILALLVTISIVPLLTGEQDTPDFDYRAAFDITQPIFPNGVVLTPIVFIVFGRGFSIGGAQFTHIGVGILVRLGIFMLFFTGILTSFPLGNDVKVLRDDLVIVLPPFFCASLLASALARSATLKIEDTLRQRRFGLPWLGFLVMLALVLTILGGLLALVLAGVDRDRALSIIEFPFVAIITLIFIIASPFLYVLDLLFTWLSGFITDEPQKQDVIGGAERPLREGRGGSQIDIGDEIRTVFNFLTEGIGLFVLITLIVFIVGFWVIAFLTREDNNSPAEASETIDQREKTGGLRRAILQRLRKLTEALGLVRQFGLGSDLFAAFTIRWAYARMERLGRKRGFPRSRSETPYEYRFALYQAFPGGEAEIRTITDAYVAIRYGELPEDAQKLDNVRKSLEHLKEIPAPKPAATEEPP